MIWRYRRKETKENFEAIVGKYFSLKVFVFMLIAGLQKMTLIDYPGKVAATVFTPGCNFRCPFCHNPELVHSSHFTVHGNEQVEKRMDEFFEFLEMRRGKLDGICITGGEPTLQPNLVEFIKKVKGLGFAVKLDSNGTRPGVLQKLLKSRLVDYVAMDIKASPENYARVCGVEANLEKIKKSVELIRDLADDYEFRTTVVPGLHSEEEFKEIADWLSGSRRYVLQAFQDQGKILDPELRKEIAGKSIDLQKVREFFIGRVGEVLIH